MPGARALAYTALELFFRNLQSQNNFRAKSQVHVLMRFFRRGVTQRNERLPTVLAMFLAEASLQVLHPEGLMVPSLLEAMGRSALDTTTVPLFNAVLTSGVQRCGQEQQWMARLLWAGLNVSSIKLWAAFELLPARSQSVGDGPSN